MEELQNIIKAEATKMNTTVKGLSQTLKFSYSAYSQYISWGKMTALNYNRFKELFPNFKDDDIEKQNETNERVIVRPKRLNKDERALKMVTDILSSEDKTVLPKVYINRTKLLLASLAVNGIQAEVYKVKQDGVMNQYLRRIN